MVGLGVALLVSCSCCLERPAPGRRHKRCVLPALGRVASDDLLTRRSITGHDIQLEYRVFQLTAAQGKWDMSLFQDPYNACLSITLLPTQMAALLHVDDPYIYKVFFQLLFAACPVLVFLLSRRYFSARVAILGVVYFVGFPTFFTDLPFLNRQEMALLFVAAAFLVMTNPLWRKRRRQRLLVGAAVGVELCHYSSSYVLSLPWPGVVAQTFFARGWPPAWTRNDPPDAKGRWSTPHPHDRCRLSGCHPRRHRGLGWGGHEDSRRRVQRGPVRRHEVPPPRRGGQGRQRQLRPLPRRLIDQPLPSQPEREQQHAARPISGRDACRRAKAAPGTFIPLSIVDRYPTPTVDQPDLPVTACRASVARVGIAPSTVNSVMRSMAAKGEQVFLLIGMLALLLSKRRRGTVGREYYYLCVGAIVASPPSPSFPISRWTTACSGFSSRP